MRLSGRGSSCERSKGQAQRQYQLIGISRSTLHNIGSTVGWDNHDAREIVVNNVRDHARHTCILIACVRARADMFDKASMKTLNRGIVDCRYANRLRNTPIGRNKVPVGIRGDGSVYRNHL